MSNSHIVFSLTCFYLIFLRKLTGLSPTKTRHATIFSGFLQPDSTIKEENAIPHSHSKTHVEPVEPLPIYARVKTLQESGSLTTPHAPIISLSEDSTPSHIHTEDQALPYSLAWLFKHTSKTFIWFPPRTTLFESQQNYERDHHNNINNERKTDSHQVPNKVQKPSPRNHNSQGSHSIENLKNKNHQRRSNAQKTAHLQLHHEKCRHFFRLAQPHSTMEEETYPYSKFPVKDPTKKQHLSSVVSLSPFLSYSPDSSYPRIYSRMGKQAQHRACAQCVSRLHINSTHQCDQRKPSIVPNISWNKLHWTMQIH